MFAGQFLHWLFRRHAMACPLVTRRVYQALHCPLTLGGVERRPFFLALVVGAAVFTLFPSFPAGLLMTGCL